MQITVDQIKKLWFPDHVATRQTVELSEGVLLEIVNWRRKDGSSIYFCRYMMVQGTLCVYGDVGEAIYRWNWSKDHPWTMEDAAKCDFGYFASKICASSEGERGKVFDSDAAKRGVLNFFKDKAKEDYLAAPGLATGAALEKRAKELYDEKIQECSESIDGITSLPEWYRWLENNGETIYGEYWTEYAGGGTIIDSRHLGHLIGLKMALGIPTGE
jgi:hypothetical protein